MPTVVGRLIQQALHQVMQPIFEPTFSDASYGFRLGRSAGQAVQRAAGYIREGRRWVVDMDLEKFFDRVNHNVLMHRVARRVEDKRVLLLIRRFLQAGMMDGGIETARTQGTPQGGPLSPLLSNILLTDLDRELERRGLAFCRYADVRGQRTARAADRGGTESVPHGATEAHRERGQERGGAALETQVSGVQRDGAQTGPPAHCAAKCSAPAGQGETLVSTRAGPLLGSDH